MEFPTKLLFVLISITVCWGVNEVFAGMVKLETLEQTEEIQADIARALSQPTPWNYYFTSVPYSGAHHLNRTVDATVVISDKQFSEVEKAIHFSLPMYVDYLRKINSVRTLRQFLLEFPATPDICVLAIRFPFQHKDMRLKEHVGCIVFRRGAEITHWIPQLQDPEHLKAVTPFILPDQIPELAALYKKGVPRHFVDPKPIIRPVLELLHYPKESFRRQFFEFIKQWTPSFHLKLILMGITDSLKSRCDDFSFVATGVQKISLREARIIAATCGKDSIQFLKTNQRCLEYIQKESAKRNFDPSPIHYLTFRISFWDENIDRVVQPFIAEVRFVDGIFSYYTADEVQSLVLEHRETFDEAMEFLEQLKEPSQAIP